MQSDNLLAILLGGVLPAIVFGCGGVLQKIIARSGMGVGLYLLTIGIGAAICGIAVFLIVPDRTVTPQAIGLSALLGLSWSIGTALIIVALQRYQVPLAKLVPLYNMNTLVTVLLALLLFSEWKDVSVLKLLLGSLLIVIGGSLVANS